MFKQTIRQTQNIAKNASGVTVASKLPMTSTKITQAFSTYPAARLPAGNSGKAKDDVTQEDLDRNKEELERLEHEPVKHQNLKGSFSRPSEEELKRRGEDAQVKQHRPDDGVY